MRELGSSCKSSTPSGQVRPYMVSSSGKVCASAPTSTAKLPGAMSPHAYDEP